MLKGSKRLASFQNISTVDITSKKFRHISDWPTSGYYYNDSDPAYFKYKSRTKSRNFSFKTLNSKHTRHNDFRSLRLVYLPPAWSFIQYFIDEDDTELRLDPYEIKDIVSRYTFERVHEESEDNFIIPIS